LEDEGYERPTRKADATYLEQLFGASTLENVADGKTNPEAYEAFTMQKFEWTAEKIIWIDFLGLGHAEESKKPGMGLSFVPSVADLIPKQGTTFVFNGPRGIAGYSPEQCIRCTEAVLQAVFHLVEKYPKHKIRIQGFCAGTHLAAFVANQLGKLKRKAIDRLVLLAPGESIAYGIYSTWVTKQIADDLLSRGITKDEYDRKISDYTQRENTEYLPSGRNLVIHAGDIDTYIPIDKKGGPDEYVKRLRSNGKNPTYVVHKGRDHVTLPTAAILWDRIGGDPWNLKQQRDAWENSATFNDKVFTNAVNMFLERFTDDGLRAMGHILAERVGSTPLYQMKPHERAVAEALVRLNICSFSPSDNRASIKIIENEGQQRKFLQDRKQSLRSGRDILDKAIAFVREIGRSDEIVPGYEVQDFAAAA